VHRCAALRHRLVTRIAVSKLGRSRQDKTARRHRVSWLRAHRSAWWALLAYFVVGVDLLEGRQAARGMVPLA